MYLLYTHKTMYIRIYTCAHLLSLVSPDRTLSWLRCRWVLRTIRPLHPIELLTKHIHHSLLTTHPTADYIVLSTYLFLK